MPVEKPRFIKVDDLAPQVTVEQAVAFYGLELPEMQRTTAEIRSRCFLACGRTADTSERALAIQVDDPTKKWKCFQNGCGKAGNFVSLCDLLKPGENAGGKPRGDRFKAIAADIAAMAAGVIRGVDVPVPAEKKPVPPPLLTNIPLVRSDNERARALVNLDEKFTTDPAVMPPKASLFFRMQPYLTPETCRRHRMGYLARSTGEDKSGGTMRGKIVYPFFSASGELLTWFGLDPEFAEKHAEWAKGDRSEKEPMKYHFVKGFHHGNELWGQHLLTDPSTQPALQSFGLPLVPEPHDAIRLHERGLPAVALISHAITREQATKAAKLAKQHAGGRVTIFLNADEAGETLMKQCLGYLAQECFVRLAWTSKTHGGQFKGRSVASLRPEEWKIVEGEKTTAA